MSLINFLKIKYQLTLFQALYRHWSTGFTVYWWLLSWKTSISTRIPIPAALNLYNHPKRQISYQFQIMSEYFRFSSRHVEPILECVDHFNRITKLYGK